MIIPAHDAAHSIEQALESLRRQTYPDWEAVVVDDGSTDRTWELLRAAGPGVRSFRRERPGGPGVARNLALANASGELVAFVDADDLLLPRYLESQIECYEGARERLSGAVGLVCCDAAITIDGRAVPHTYLDRVGDRAAPLTLERVLHRNPIYTACLVPAMVGEAVGWFDPELFVAEDYGLWIKILEAGYRAVLNDRVLAVYRRKAGTASSDIVRLGANNRRAYELALARGRLTRKQVRIARRAIRYNRAMEEVARIRFDRTGRWRSRLPALASLPRLAWVAFGNPRMWSRWFQLLHTGRADDAIELRARS